MRKKSLLSFVSTRRIALVLLSRLGSTCGRVHLALDIRLLRLETRFLDG